MDVVFPLCHSKSGGTIMKKQKYIKFLFSIFLMCILLSVAPVTRTRMLPADGRISSYVGEAFNDVKAVLENNIALLSPMAKAVSNYTYDEKTSTLTVSGMGDMPDYTIDTIPWKAYASAENIVVDGGVEKIGNYAFYGFSNVKSVTITAPVKIIGVSAFANCSSLETLTFPDGLLKIYGKAFQNCISLESIVIPDSVTAVYTGAFNGCYPESLTAPFVGGGSGNTASNKTDQLGYMFGTDVFDDTYTVTSKADKKKLYIPYSLKEVTITKNLYEYNFQSAVGIEKIVVEDTVVSTLIPRCFAHMCSNLKEVIIKSNSITTIGATSFRTCALLEKVQLPESVTAIGEYAFANTPMLSEIVFPSGDFYVRRNAFMECRFVNDYPEDFLIVGNGVLIWYKGTQTNVVVPDNVKRICCPWDSRSDITSVTLPDGLEYIGTDSFYGCTGITELIVPDSVTEIKSEAFSGMCNLKKLDVPFIGDNINVTSDSKESTIGYWFEYGDSGCTVCKGNNCGKRKKYYTKSGKRYYYYSSGPKRMSELTIRDGIIHMNSTAAYSISTVNILPTVDGIEENGLYNSGITNLVVSPNWSIESLPDNAFAKNNIKSIDIPDNVKHMGTAFVSNPITTLVLHEGLETINGTFESTSITSVVIPDSVTTISGYAFKDCLKLSEVHIGENVEEISYTAFKGSPVEKFTVSKNNKNYFSEYGIVYTNDGTLVAYPMGSKSDTYKISSAVTKVPYETLSQLNNIACFDVAEDNPNYFSCDGVLYSSNGEMVKYPPKKVASVFVMDERVTHYIHNEDDYLANIQEFSVSEDNERYRSIDGVLYSKDLSILIAYPRARQGEDYVALDDVKMVNDYAFYKTKLGRLEFPNDVEFDQDCFYAADMTELVVVNIPRRLSHYFGYTYNNETNVIRPRSLEKMVLTNQTTPIDHKFAYNFGLKAIEMNGSFTYIGEYAFDLNDLKEVVLPDTVEYIDDYAFNQSLDLKKFYFGKSLKHIGKWAFSRAELTEIDLPDTVEYIGDCAFASTCIKEVVLGPNVTEVGRSVFSGSSLVKATINESLVDLTDKLFNGCEFLETVVIGGSVENISENVFEACTSLQTVIIPDSVVSISDTAFKDANENATIYCNEGSYAEQYAIANNIKYTTLVIAPIENQLYTGKAITPEPSVSSNGNTLSKNVEYTLSYKDNVNAGTATINAKGLGDFKHLIAVAKFKILPKTPTDIRIVCTNTEYLPEGINPKIVVIDGVDKLVEGKDYEIIGVNYPWKVGTNNYTISFIDNYSGVKNASVKITARPLNKAKVSFENGVVVTDRNGTLKEGVDYVVEHTTDIQGNKVTTVRGIGNYTGSVSQSKEGSGSLSLFEIIINFIVKLFSGLFK